MLKKGIILRDKCPICKSTSSKSIFNRNFNEDIIKEYMNLNYHGNANIDFLEDVIFEIVQCNGCKISYQKYGLDEERLNELYNEWIDPKLAIEWNEIGKTEKNRGYTNILNFAKRHLKKAPSMIKVLDYGAGFGDSLLLAKEMGFDAYAYEYSSERIQFLEERGIKTIDDKNEILFDLIICNQVLEHLTFPNKILKVINGKLINNGLVYIAVPHCPYLKMKLKKTNKIMDAEELDKFLINASVNAFQHINFFTNSSLKLLFKMNGLKPISPFKLALDNPSSIKTILRPFYRYYFGSSFFLTKSEK